MLHSNVRFALLLVGVMLDGYHLLVLQRTVHQLRPGQVLLKASDPSYLVSHQTFSQICNQCRRKTGHPSVRVSSATSLIHAGYNTCVLLMTAFQHCQQILLAC